MRAERGRVDEYGVTAGRAHDRNIARDEPCGHIFHGGVTIALVFAIQGFHQPDGDRLEVAPREPAVSRKSFRQDQQVTEVLGPAVIVAAEKSADIGQSVLLGAHRGPVGQRKHFPRDLQQASLRIARLVFPDEI